MTHPVVGNTTATQTAKSAMPCYEEGGLACVNTEAVTNPLEDGLMSEDYQGSGWELLADKRPPVGAMCDWGCTSHGQVSRWEGRWVEQGLGTADSLPGFRGSLVQFQGFDCAGQGLFVSPPGETSWKLHGSPINANVNHIRHTHADLEGQSWCGKQLSRSDWTFQGIDHAIYAIREGTFQEPCEDCLRAISEVMQVTDENLRAFKRGYAAALASHSSFLEP